MALTLLTVGMVGNTLAKYVTKYTGDDSARVAQWGVKVDGQLSHELVKNEFDLFKTTYDGDGDTSVVSNYYLDNTDPENPVYAQATEDSVNDFVFAPGTTGSMEITVTGKPEVAFQFHFDLGIEYVGDWKDNNGEEYHPILFTLGTSTDEGATITPFTVDEVECENITLEELVTAMDNIEKGMLVENQEVTDEIYAPNTDIAKDIMGFTDEEIEADIKVYVSWVWPFESYTDETEDDIKIIAVTDENPLPEGYTLNDAKDTFLGDIAAVCIAGEGENGITTSIDGESIINLEMPNIKLDVQLGATQVDTYTAP